MSPVTHFLAGWLVANAAPGAGRKERAAITLAAVAPDLDGLGIVPELLTRNTDHPLLWFSDYHHLLAHNLLASMVAASAAFLLCSKRWLAAGFVLLNFHLHLLCDLVGSRGPDGHQWPIPYLWPFSKAWQWTWSGQWHLDAWPNFVITGAVLVVTCALAHKRGFSPVEMISVKADQAVIDTVRSRF
jgi:hypothetical protein